MTFASETRSVEREVRIAARPDVVFEYFVDPAKMVRWKGVSAELDPRVGGVYRVNISGNDIARGHYVEVVPFERIVFTWGWEGDDSILPPGSSTVEVSLHPDGDDTIVRLIHRDLPLTTREQFAAGWDHFLPRLALIASGSDPGTDPWAMAGHADV